MIELIIITFINRRFNNFVSTISHIRIEFIKIINNQAIVSHSALCHSKNNHFKSSTKTRQIREKIKNLHETLNDLLIIIVQLTTTTTLVKKVKSMSLMKMTRRKLLKNLLKISVMIKTLSIRKISITMIRITNLTILRTTFSQLISWFLRLQLSVVDVTKHLNLTINYTFIYASIVKLICERFSQF